MGGSIAIVDDERIVAYGINSLLSEALPDYEVVGVFRSGEECLRFCLETPPDILFTDICMPGVSGLDLIKEIRLGNKMMKIVVLSCHDEFDKVHNAFILGADEYILKKDIDKECLFKVVRKMVPDNTEPVSTEYEKGIRPFADVEKQTVETRGVLGVLGFKDEYDSSGKLLPWQPDMRILSQFILEELGSPGKCYSASQNKIVIFYVGADECLDGRSFGCLEKIRITVSKYFNRKVFIAGRIVEANAIYGPEHQKGLKILEGLFYLQDSSILTKETQVPRWEKSFSFSMTGNNLLESWKTGLDNFLDEAEKHYYSPGAVKAELVYAVKYLINHLQQNSGSDSPALIDENRDYYKTIDLFHDIRVLKNWFGDFLSGLFENLEKSKLYRNAVFSARLYIQEHLDEDLRLSIVSNHLNIHANYLSTLFKKEMNLSFIDYVNQLRVERAYELIETTDYSAKEIAHRCGYQNPNYFSRIFKKITGITVSEYKLK